MISILVPSIRPNGLDIVAKAIQKQTHEDWELLICSPFDPQIDWATWIPDTFTGGYWSLNRAYNALLKQSKGSLLVSWQDFIYATPGALESFWDSYKATEGRACISGVGDQYAKLDAYGKPYEKIWLDPRKTRKYGSFYECTWNDIEYNFAAIPKTLLDYVGGFDEQLDFLGFGGDQMQVSDRMNDAGFSFYLDQENESYTLRHDRSDFGGQEAWDKNHTLFNGAYQKRKKELIALDSWPILVDNARKVS